MNILSRIRGNREPEVEVAVVETARDRLRAARDRLGEMRAQDVSLYARERAFEGERAAIRARAAELEALRGERTQVLAEAEVGGRLADIAWIDQRIAEIERDVTAGRDRLAVVEAAIASLGAKRIALQTGIVEATSELGRCLYSAAVDHSDEGAPGYIAACRALEVAWVEMEARLVARNVASQSGKFGPAVGQLPHRLTHAAPVTYSPLAPLMGERNLSSEIEARARQILAELGA